MHGAWDETMGMESCRQWTDGENRKRVK